MASKTLTATRMALLDTKKRIKLASKGHKLLKEKRDALISEFFAIINELKGIRGSMEKELAEAYRSLIIAQAVSGMADVKRAAETTKELPDISSRTRTIMGIKVPEFTWDNIGSKVTDKGYSLVSTSLELDNAAKKFENALNTLVRVAEKEAAVKKLADEIKKTKRKVNALERILIPRLESQRFYITMRLEEMERENFGRLKIIKANISAE